MKKSVLLLFVAFATSCSNTKDIVKVQPGTEKEQYAKSIEVAMSPTEAKIDHNLIAIKEGNPDLIFKEINGEQYLSVVTWKQNVSYYEGYAGKDSLYNTGPYEIWITAAPQLQNAMDTSNYDNVDLRVKQLLGLPPNSEYSYFVEVWVKPSDLFRPCPDNEIDDSKCELCFPEGTTQEYKDWVDGNRISRYYKCELYDKYPWTQLGYTYDWSPTNKSHRGLSEFVIRKNAKVYIQAIVPTKEYLGIE